MGKNLCHELRTAVFDSFHEGIDKHAVKANGGGDSLVFSYAQKGQLLDVATNFATWIKDNMPEIKKPWQLTSDHARVYLEHKVAGDCTQETITTYRSALIKLGECVNRRFKANIDLHTEKLTANVPKSAQRGAESVISRSDYERLIAYGDAHKPCGSAIAIKLERELGVRVGDAAYGLRVRPDGIEVHGKGNRIILRVYTPELRAIVERMEAAGMVRADGKINLPKDDSVNTYLRRTQDKLGLERHSFQDLRRYVAQEHYDSYRRAGMTRQEALSETGKWLSHGEEREKLVLESYVAHAW